MDLRAVNEAIEAIADELDGADAVDWKFGPVDMVTGPNVRVPVVVPDRLARRLAQFSQRRVFGGAVGLLLYRRFQALQPLQLPVDVGQDLTAPQEQ